MHFCQNFQTIGKNNWILAHITFCYLQEKVDTVHCPVCETFLQNRFFLNDGLPKGGLPKKKRYFLGIFPKRGEGGHPISQNFCKITKSFLACQIHPKVLKHVFHTGGSNI